MGAAVPASIHSGKSGIFPSLAELLDTRAPFLAPLLLTLISRTFFWIKLPLASEDAYITFRYARNLAEGHGLVYNVGERVMGYSSPIWTKWNALGILLTHNPVLWSRVSSLGMDVLTILVVGAMLRRAFGNAPAWAFAFFFAAWPYFAAMSASGMEVNAMLALIALAAAAIASGSRWAGPLLAVVVFIRPEGMVAALVLGLGARNRDRWIALAAVSVGLVSTWLYYGSIFPQSVLAKSALYGTPGPWAGRFWWEWAVPFPMGRWPTVAEGNQIFFLAVVLAPAAWMGARALWAERRSPVALAAAALISVWLGYAVLGVAYFPWYFMAPLSGMALLASVGLPRLARGRAIPIACALYILGAWSVVPMFYLGRAAHEQLAFSGVAGYLEQNARAGDAVMLEPIGLVGYRAPVRIIDEVGLISPQVVKRRLQGDGWYTDIVALEKPEWLVVRRAELEGAPGFAGKGQPFRSRAERDTVFAGYDYLTEVGEAEGTQAMLVFRRKNAGAPK